MSIRKAFYLRNTSSQNQSYSKETEMRIHTLTHEMSLYSHLNGNSSSFPTSSHPRSVYKMMYCLDSGLDGLTSASIFLFSLMNKQTHCFHYIHIYGGCDWLGCPVPKKSTEVMGSITMRANSLCSLAWPVSLP